MKVLIIGSGGREHALGWAIARLAPGTQLLFAPGNAGTEQIGKNFAVRATDLDALLRLSEEERPDFTLVGPEAPLVAGLVDRFRAAGRAIFGPTRAAAEIEGSKVFSKDLLRRAKVPTAAFAVTHSASEARARLESVEYPQVIKVDGLAAGKGVYIAGSPEEAQAALGEIFDQGRFGEAGARIVIEQFLDGEEISAFALCRGEEFRLLPFSRDYKRVADGDQGPNTGGMGAIAPHPRSDAWLDAAVSTQVFAPVLAALAREGRPFDGLLYAGLMMVDRTPYVLEFNCRFGDPETEALMPLMGDGFVAALEAVARREGPLPEVRCWSESGRSGSASSAGHSATVILAAGGYPGEYQTGFPIRGIERAEAYPETFVFHAGSARVGHDLLTAGGRVLAVTGRAGDPITALDRAYAAADAIEFEGAFCRRDIGRGIRP
ncbi:MAG: phosphoribosylamine--glycine ligase [Candidatus Eisenbacteria bacterium]|nr:phosphoribosylamine--glycine ligase [Candidatus Eisenbacteria bacterium]